MPRRFCTSCPEFRNCEWFIWSTISAWRTRRRRRDSWVCSRDRKSWSGSRSATPNRSRALPKKAQRTRTRVRIMHWAFWISIVLLVYVHAGYWLLLRILPGRRRARVDQPLPAVSLIIPAHNEAQCLGAKLRNALDEIDYPGELLEVIVASDASSDATVAIARSFEPRGVRVLDFDQRRGKASVL